jgi:hypothetical protein
MLTLVMVGLILPALFLGLAGRQAIPLEVRSRRIY